LEELVKKLYFEDMQVGDTAESMGRTITEADIVGFAGLSGDYNTLHTDAEFAKNSIAGQRIAHGMLPLVVSSGLYTRTAYNLAMMEQLTAMTEIRSWKFKKPVVIGDTIRVMQELVEKSDPRPDSNSGKIVFRRTVLNQRGEVIQQGELVQLIKKRGK
jgi:acyl dehydratase